MSCVDSDMSEKNDQSEEEKPSQTSLEFMFCLGKLALLNFEPLNKVDEELANQSLQVQKIVLLSQSSSRKTVIRSGKHKIRDLASIMNSVNEFWMSVYSGKRTVDLSQVLEHGFLDTNMVADISADVDNDEQLLDSFIIPHILSDIKEAGECNEISIDNIQCGLKYLNTLKRKIIVFFGEWQKAFDAVSKEVEEGMPTKSALLLSFSKAFVEGNDRIKSLIERLDERIKIYKHGLKGWDIIRSSVKSVVAKSGYIKQLLDYISFTGQFWQGWNYHLRQLNNGEPLDNPLHSEVIRNIMNSTLNRFCFPGYDDPSPRMEIPQWSTEKNSKHGWIDHHNFIKRTNVSLGNSTLMPDDRMYQLCVYNRADGEHMLKMASCLSSIDSPVLDARGYIIPAVKRWIRIGPCCTKLFPGSEEWVEGSSIYGLEIQRYRYWKPLDEVFLSSKGDQFCRILSVCSVNGSLARNLCWLFRHFRNANVSFDNVHNAASSISVNPKGKIRLNNIGLLNIYTNSDKQNATILAQILASCFLVSRYNERSGVTQLDWILSNASNDGYLLLLSQVHNNPNWSFDTWIQMVEISSLSHEGLQRRIGFNDVPIGIGANNQINVLAPILMKIYDGMEDRRPNVEKTSFYSRDGTLFPTLLKYFLECGDEQEKVCQDVAKRLNHIKKVELQKLEPVLVEQRRIVSTRSQSRMQTIDLTNADNVVREWHPTLRANQSDTLSYGEWMEIPSSNDGLDRLPEDPNYEDDEDSEYEDGHRIRYVPSFAFQGESGVGIGVTSEVLAYFWDSVLDNHKFFASSCSGQGERYYYIDDPTDSQGNDIPCPGCSDGKRCVLYSIPKVIARIWAQAFITLEDEYNRLLPYSLATFVLKSLITSSSLLTNIKEKDDMARLLSVMVDEDDIRETDGLLWTRLRHINNMSRKEMASFIEDENSDALYGTINAQFNAIGMGNIRMTVDDIEEFRYASIEQRFFSGIRANFYFDLARHWQTLLRDYMDVSLLHVDSLRYFLSGKPSVDVSLIVARLEVVSTEGAKLSKHSLSAYRKQFVDWMLTLDQSHLRALLKYWTGQCLIPHHATFVIEFAKNALAEVRSATCHTTIVFSSVAFPEPEKFGEWCKKEFSQFILTRTSLKYNIM